MCDQICSMIQIAKIRISPNSIWIIFTFTSTIIASNIKINNPGLSTKIIGEANKFFWRGRVLNLGGLTFTQDCPHTEEKDIRTCASDGIISLYPTSQVIPCTSEKKTWISNPYSLCMARIASCSL